jgi:hypothetical protein
MTTKLERIYIATYSPFTLAVLNSLFHPESYIAKPIATNAANRTHPKETPYPTDPPLGATVLGPSPFLGPVIEAEGADELAAAADDEVRADEVAGTLAVLVPIADPGNGAIEGAEKLPNPLGTPVALGNLSLSSFRLMIRGGRLLTGVYHLYRLVQWPSTNYRIRSLGDQLPTWISGAACLCLPISMASLNADPSYAGLALSRTLNLSFWPEGTFTR